MSCVPILFSLDGEHIPIGRVIVGFVLPVSDVGFFCSGLLVADKKTIVSVEEVGDEQLERLKWGLPSGDCKGGLFDVAFVGVEITWLPYSVFADFRTTGDEGEYSFLFRFDFGVDWFLGLQG